MKNTATKRILSILLVALMVIPSFSFALPVAAAAESDHSDIALDDSIELTDDLSADNYTSYLSSTLSSLRYNKSVSSTILLSAYNDGRDTENQKMGRLYEIWQQLEKENLVDATSSGVDSEADVLLLDDKSKNLIISRLDDEEIIKYLRASSNFELPLENYVAFGDDGKIRPAVDDDYGEGTSGTIKAKFENAVYLPDQGNITWTFTLPEGSSGFYNIRFDYFAVEGSSSAIERMMYVDGEILCSEARSLSFAKTWQYLYYDGNENGEPDCFEKGNKHAFQQDAIGNDVRPDIVQKLDWRTYYCSDPEGYYSDNFQFYFNGDGTVEERTHTITLTGVREPLIIGGITLSVPQEILTYDEYIAIHEAASGGHAYGEDVVKMQGETPTYVSDKSIYMSNDRSSPINSPSNASSQYYNVIGKSGYSSTGQWAAYEFEVETSGFYSIAMRYRQNLLEGMFVSRSIKIWSDDPNDMYGLEDGTPTLPFKEAGETRFDYSDDWQSSKIGDGSQKFEFYFEKGVTYRIYLEVSLGQLAEIIQSVQESLKVINDCYLNILKLTGANPDEYRNYNFNQVMPGTIRNLLLESNNLKRVAKQLKDLCGTGGSHVATLTSIYQLLARMGTKESEIASNLSTLKSYIGTLGTWINTSKAQGLPFDFFVIQSPKAKLPRAESTIWETIGFEIKSFFASFVVDYNNMGASDSDQKYDTTIEVWLATGRDQSLIWRNMIDNGFSKENPITVQLKLVTGGTLLPSVLAGQGPDVYLGLASEETVNYAIRGAVLPIQDFEGYNTTLGYDRYNAETNTYFDKNGKEIPISEINFNNATVIPLSLYGKTYGLPETTLFPMLFYRKDILREEGMPIPTTWDELLYEATIFQSSNMDVGLAYAGAINIFIYQNGGSLWRFEDSEIYKEEYAGARIGLDSDEALGAFENLVRLYTDYSFPVGFDGPNRFRTGEMPLLVAEYSATYNQLIVFASEISGLWAFASLPGTERVNQNGETIIDRRSVASVTSVIMMEGCDDKEESWKFMQWQAGAEVQSEYGNSIVALVGPAAKHPTSNMQALKNLSWSTAESNALLEQFEQLAAVANYPGSYIIGRYTNFAFLDAVNSSADPVESLQGYITIINKELARKRKEFELPKWEPGKELRTSDTPLVSD